MSNQKRPQVGETYTCIKSIDYRFLQGIKYKCEKYGCLTNEKGNKEHSIGVTEGFLDEYFKQFFTIKDLADGKCAVDNTGNPDVEKLNKILQSAFPDYRNAEGDCIFYSKISDNFSNNKWRARDETDLPTQLLADFELPEEKLEMVEGEYYRIDDVIGGNPFWMILKCEGHVHIDDEKGDCNGKLILHSERNRYKYQKDGCCFWNNRGRNFRKATQDEINWLDARIAADKFISYEDYPRQYMQVDTQEEEEKAHNDEKFYLPKIEIIQKWMFVSDDDINLVKTKRFVLCKIHNSNQPFIAVSFGNEPMFFNNEKYVTEMWGFAEELPNHDGTEREIDGQTYLLTLKK